MQKLGDALVVSNNPPGVVYLATLPEVAFTKGSAYANGGNAKGHVSAVASPDGVGVMFSVHFSNLPKEGGPFSKSNFSLSASRCVPSTSRDNVPHHKEGEGHNADQLTTRVSPSRYAGSREWQLHRRAGAPGPLHPRGDPVLQLFGSGNVRGRRPERQVG